MADGTPATNDARAQLIVERFARDALIVLVGVAIVWVGGVLRSLHLADGERDVFEAVNHLPDGLRPPIEGVMFLGTLAAVPIVAVVALVQRRVRLGVLLLCAG